MEVRYFVYWAIENGENLTPNAIPSEIRGELMSGGAFNTQVAVDADKTKIVAALDRFCEIGKRRRFARELRVEIDHHEIAQYRYFFIKPHVFEWNRSVSFEESQPICTTEETCPWGVRRTSPVTLDERAAGRNEFGVITLGWSGEIELVISERLKGIFDDANVTGLAYEHCIVSRTGDEDEPRCYVGRVLPSDFAECGADAIFGNSCAKHRMVHTAIVSGLKYVGCRSNTADFALIDRLLIGKETWRYYLPQWVISARVALLLRNHRVRGLKNFGFALKSPFRPMVPELELVK